MSEKMQHQQSRPPRTGSHPSAGGSEKQDPRREGDPRNLPHGVPSQPPAGAGPNHGSPDNERRSGPVQRGQPAERKPKTSPDSQMEDGESGNKTGHSQGQNAPGARGSGQHHPR